MRLLFSFLICAVISADTYACGESLYRVGKGVDYREYTAPLPGNLLIYGAAGDSSSLAAELEKAGHTVSIASSPSELVRLADQGKYQVVIGPYADYNEYLSMSVLADVEYLPIAVSGVNEKQAKQEFDDVLVPSKHEIRHYLKAIHKALKRA
jgi:hypothetical protein